MKRIGHEVDEVKLCFENNQTNLIKRKYNILKMFQCTVLLFLTSNHYEIFKKR